MSQTIDEMISLKLEFKIIKMMKWLSKKMTKNLLPFDHFKLA